MQNWFETLRQALESEGIQDTWDMSFPSISYGQCFRYNAEIDGYIKHVSIYRETDGRYERPIVYKIRKA